MKLPLVLCILGILGFSLTSSTTKQTGGSIQDEFAVSIRDQAPALSIADTEVQDSTNVKKVEGL